MRNLFYILIVLALTSCKQETKTADNTKIEQTSISHDDIKRLEKKIYNNKTQISEASKTELNEAYLNFVKEHPEDNRCPDYLFRAANIIRSQQKYDEAIQLCQQTIQKYPSFEKVDAVHFFIAFIYDNDIQDKDKASTVYSKVAEKYPDTQFGKDAKARLKTIHLTDEELIEFFEKNNPNTTQK